MTRKVVVGVGMNDLRQFVDLDLPGGWCVIESKQVNLANGERGEYVTGVTCVQGYTVGILSDPQTTAVGTEVVVTGDHSLPQVATSTPHGATGMRRAAFQQVVRELDIMLGGTGTARAPVA